MTNGSARMVYSAPADLTPAALASLLRTAVPVRIEPPARVARSCLDTFDWRLWKRGARLSLEESLPGGKTAIVWAPAERAPLRIPVVEVPRFASRVPAGVARDALESATQGRALLVLGRLEAEQRLLRALDRRDKTVAKVWWSQWTVLDADGGQHGARHRVVEIEPLAGYAATAARLARMVAGRAGVAAPADDELTLAAAALGRRPGDYSSRFEVTLDPEANAAEAARTILTALLGAIRANVDGTVEDLDAEFLHDLRVAVRRTRSALGQLRDVLDPARTALPVEEFRWLGQVTGPCRDADVHLEALAEASASAPDDLREGVEAFAAWLRGVRQDSWRQLVADLRSPRFAGLLRRWTRFLAGPWDVRRTARGGEPVGDVASERIVRAHRRLARHVEALEPGLPPGPLHVLRIDAKKLRYLLEFFASLCDPAASGPLIAELRALQDELGAFHDAYLQRQRVLAAGEAMLAAGTGRARTLLAMGFLAGGLETRQRREGEAFLARIPAFVTAETSERFAGLLRGRPGG